MDTWKYFDIIHREHQFCNPMSNRKFEHLIGLLRLHSKSQVLDIASGKGELIIQLAKRYRISGIGIDISPYCVAEARARAMARAPGADIAFLEMDAAEYRPGQPHSFDLAACLGASWIFGGLQGTLEALNHMAKPGGYVVTGEPYWLQEPTAAYLETAGFKRDTFASHEGNVRIGEELGLTLLYAVVSNHDDWDKYEGLTWYAAENYALANPDDPDVPELLEKVRKSKREYLKWGRWTLGWAIYVFRKASD